MTDDHSRIEDLLYYLHLMSLRGYSGSCIVWMYGGRISRSTFQKLRHQLRVAGIPFEAEREQEEVVTDAGQEAR